MIVTPELAARKAAAYRSMLTVERSLKALMRGYREDDERTFNLVIALFRTLDEEMFRLAVDSARKGADGHAEAVKALRRCHAALGERIDEISEKSTDVQRCARAERN